MSKELRPERAVVSVPEAARILDIARGTAYRGVQEGWLPAIRLGRRLVVPIAALEELLQVKPKEGR